MSDDIRLMQNMSQQMYLRTTPKNSFLSPEKSSHPHMLRQKDDYILGLLLSDVIS